MKRGRSFLRYRRGARDANHAAIRDGLRALGHFVVDLAGVGDGVPDLLVISRAGFSFVFGWVEAKPTFLELKVGKGKLRESQKAWKAAAVARGVAVATVRTLDEALDAIMARADKTRHNANTAAREAS